MNSPLSEFRREALWGLVACSHLLVELYRTLGDSKQRDRGMRLGTYAIEQLQRANLYKVADLRQRVAELKAGITDDTALERQAWQRGIQSGFEMGFLVALGTGAGDRQGLQGAMNQIQRTLGAGVLGIDTAFPIEEASVMAKTSLDVAESVARGVLEAQFKENNEGLSEAEVAFLISGSLPPVREAIWTAVVGLRPDWA